MVVGGGSGGGARQPGQGPWSRVASLVPGAFGSDRTLALFWKSGCSDGSAL